MNKVILSFIGGFLLLTGCAVVTVESQLAPNTTLSKDAPLYIEREQDASIDLQKYEAALLNAAKAAGINVVSEKDKAHYLMRVGINEFVAPVSIKVPQRKTTEINGNIGTVPVSGTATTYSTKTVQRSIPTHNSQLIVTEKESGRIVWTGHLAKSYEVTSHPELRKMIDKLLGLYGREAKSNVIVGDEIRM